VIKKWRRYIKNPLFIGSVLNVLLIFALARFLPFYITENIEDSVITNHGEIYFFYLDHVGISEKLNYYHFVRIIKLYLYLYNSNV